MDRLAYEGAVQRAGVFAELPAILSEAGVDPREIFDNSGISLADLRFDTRLPLTQILTCFNNASTQLNCPHLGLLVGSRFVFDIHGPIGRLMRAAETLEQALVDFVTWQQGYSTAAVVYLNRVSGGVAFGYGCYVRSAPGLRQLYDCILAVACRMVSGLTDDCVRPAEILLSQRRPQDTQPYMTYLRAPLRFDQPQSCVIIDQDALRFPLPNRNAAVRREALTELKDLLAKFNPTTATRVAHQLKPLLHMGVPELDVLANNLGLHPRTLRRHLKAEGTTFEAIRDKVRLTLACELLEMTDLPVGAISDAVAYSTQSAFLAAFRRWTGTTPTLWRKQQA